MDVVKRGHELEMRELANGQIELLQKQIDLLTPKPKVSKFESRSNALKSFMNQSKPDMAEGVGEAFKRRRLDNHRRF